MLSDKHLHIISFNVPYPPNYGGIIDVYYKLKSLAQAGVKIHLHTFHYGRKEAPTLKEICEEVHYYPRESFYKAIYSSIPYIVGSRKSGDLLARLSADQYPILFEGLHTCFYLNHPSIKHKKRVVRMHNLEWEYYASLGKAERNFFLKFYFYSEAKKLKHYEEQLQYADMILAISLPDMEYLSKRYQNVVYLPAFHPNDKVTSLTGMGDYALYHGNLKVSENNQAAMFLLMKVFHGLDMKLILAGMNPSSALTKAVKNTANEIIPNPDEATMDRLIHQAHIQTLPTFQSTGVKLKLLNALFRGRHVLVNKQMVENTGLEDMCIISTDAEDMRNKVRELSNKPFTQEDFEKRETYLMEHYSNSVNAERIISLLYSFLL